MSDNQRVLDLAAEIRRVDGNHSLGAAALAEALEPWIEAVVAEVRSDLLNEVTPYYRQEYWVNKGRQAAARVALGLTSLTVSTSATICASTTPGSRRASRKM